MREKYESLSVTALKDVAKARGLKNISAMKKSELVAAMLREDEKQAEQQNEAGEDTTENKAVCNKADTNKTDTNKADSNKTENKMTESEMDKLDSGIAAKGILEVLPDGYGFIRCANYLPGENDVYVSPSQIRRFSLKTGDIIEGNTRVKTQAEKFSALLFVKSINGFHPSEASRRRNFEDMTPIFPNERLRLETNGKATSMRIVDLISPVV
ncbi:hypothetical protein CG709_19105 [Lachnotalea glycerini]|nr:hypothetical protein CG709_19105 [Lachnotalea glycerini]